jgi:hypothetical protein
VVTHQSDLFFQGFKARFVAGGIGTFLLNLDGLFPRQGLQDIDTLG